MKRTKKLRKKLLARLERFELRICMAGDLFALPHEAIDVLDPIPVADFVDSPSVEQPEDFFNHEPGASSKTDLVEFFPASDGIVDFVDEFIHVWDDNIEPDDLLSVGQGQIDSDSEPSNFFPDDVVGFLPVESETSADPSANSPSIPDSDLRTDRLPPRRNETVPDDESLGTADRPVDSGGGISIKTPDPPPKEDPNPRPQPSPPLEDDDARLNFSPWYQESANPAANRVEPTKNVFGATAFENRSASGFRNLEVALPSASRDMQRFSSTDIAFTIIHHKVADPSFTADAPALRPFASLRQSVQDSPKYFARHVDFRSRVAPLRESYSDPTVGHETADVDRGISDQIAGDEMIKNAYGTGSAVRSVYPVAAVLTGLFFSAESESAPEPAQRATNAFPSDGIAPARMNFHPSEPERESPSPREHRSPQRFLGLIMAGALITLQETSRTLKNLFEQENSLHPKRISALKNSSNS